MTEDSKKNLWGLLVAAVVIGVYEYSQNRSRQLQQRVDEYERRKVERQRFEEQLPTA
jgi:hypothetical protein